ncbi:Gfo/Idh/MocA family oxidoreductase [Panacibacter ginsenosidivorans]|uniref:Gfo/Idh/MocA family oxidoreductase n=1 Tax=Panacibacter ginsenosidivorans TaxID=1813871 RepID=A0A5B8VDD7_9BACT|nr:Gfo/Idh/MocA family oxidoreductase [Panacibacter ginsenosidivorans]QEC69065.1 Gfo/Idh/MocA family oxidoreductase [Panacibacter ginsenosidivorans]
MRTNNQAILVIGAGSIGERHIRNLWQLGYNNIIVYRQRNLPFRDIGEARVKLILEWNEVVTQRPFAAIICTPTAQHLQQTQQCLDANMHVLVEKPLSHQLFDKEQLITLLGEKKLLLQVGYMLHYHPLLQKVKSFIEAKTFGNVINIQTYWGEYLPDWHPWEDYRTSYAANKEHGGGAALTLSHDVDLVNWFMNALPKEHKVMHNYASTLKVNTDSAFDALLSYANRATAHVHVNFCQKVPQRWYKIVFDEAVIDIDYYQASMKISTKENIHEEQLSNFARNELFIDELEDFFKRIETGNFTGFSKQQVEQSYSIIKICQHEQ